MNPVLRSVERSFALLALAVSAVAWLAPGPFILLRPLIPILLGVIMFAMGATLTAEDFRGVGRKWRTVLLVSGFQFSIMPLAAFALALIFGLEKESAAGLVLVGCCPGGTASNVICYLAGADLALSVTLTLFSTLLAPLATPLIFWALAHQWIPVPVWSLLQSILAIVIVPLAAGLGLRRMAPSLVRRITPYLPSVSISAIIAIIACVLALNRGDLGRLPLAVAAAVILHNAAGFALGYLGARLFRLDRRTARTASVEVGMQNSGLGVSLALAYLSPLAAVPGALFSLWQNLAGAALANWWRSRPAWQLNE
ncbi:MAG: hypothetical protein A3F83_14320 [Candidatus Glassbacteria bacterium RIFCSPLOWO2_12_FULL_58_11]|uniref:Bile acid:sodium symporter n=1 Tax=Candidatus Glassbacteria bacterium RIFCSPLOWO2_12_FULL_58_11 TaxID=1817867 RepID=A0A1F5YYP9_9BACT|nr:MAG: hypothetical protein A3F83_14320 [Candidatus Glassbacteria bacterium RIFCSPLOWO2_12_FULL_58_11]